MAWFFGAGLGWFVGGPLGAIIGGALQHSLSQSARLEIEQNGTPTNDETIFVTNLVAIMTKICMADGHISRDERGLIHQFFEKSLGYREKELAIIDAIINETDRRNPDLRQICMAFRKYANHEQHLIFLDLAYNIAAVDHIITKEEQKAIDEMVSALGISSEEHERIRGRHAVATKSGHYTILGVESSASDEEIKKAYRMLATQYHPDKVSHLGQELIDFANNKFREINESYQAIREERGF